MHFALLSAGLPPSFPDTHKSFSIIKILVNFQKFACWLHQSVKSKPQSCSFFMMCSLYYWQSFFWWRPNRENDEGQDYFLWKPSPKPAMQSLQSSSTLLLWQKIHGGKTQTSLLSSMTVEQILRKLKTNKIFVDIGSLSCCPDDSQKYSRIQISRHFQSFLMPTFFWLFIF